MFPTHLRRSGLLTAGTESVTSIVVIVSQVFARVQTHQTVHTNVRGFLYVDYASIEFAFVGLRVMTAGKEEFCVTVF